MQTNSVRVGFSTPFLASSPKTVRRLWKLLAGSLFVVPPIQITCASFPFSGGSSSISPVRCLDGKTRMLSSAIFKPMIEKMSKIPSLSNVIKTGLLAPHVFTLPHTRSSSVQSFSAVGKAGTHSGITGTSGSRGHAAPSR